VGFKGQKPQESRVIQSFVVRVFHTYTRVTVETVTYIHGSGKSWMSTGQEGKVMYASGNMLVQGSYNNTEFPGLSAVYNSLSGPFSLLREP
jgi:hypothetical protein